MEPIPGTPRHAGMPGRRHRQPSSGPCIPRTGNSEHRFFERAPSMARVLTVLFRRDSSRDRQTANAIALEGYQLLWPDGRPVTYGLQAFCRHAQRILGLQRCLAGCDERLLELTVFPLRGREDELTRVAGLRVRRFLMKRQGPCGRIHLLNDAPTEISFEVGRDEQRVVDWIGLTARRAGEQVWFDFTGRAAELG